MFNDLKKLLICKLQVSGESEAQNRGQKLGNNVNVLQLWFANQSHSLFINYKWIFDFMIINFIRVLIDIWVFVSINRKTK